MAEKIPVIVDNRGDNKVLHDFQTILPKLKVDSSILVLEV